MPNDYLKKQPTKTEKYCFELAMQQQKVEAAVVSLQRTLYALLAVMETDINFTELVKTIRNDMRIQNISMKMMATEMEIKKQEEDSKKVIVPK